jgi:periplasmic divalent cation tolerance protein
MSDAADDPVFVYIAAPSHAEAVKIGRVLVAERLAACANALPGARSVYWWQGKMEEADEAVLVAKSRARLTGRLIDRVKSLHSYTCPAIVVLPIVAGNPEYLAWIAAETEEPQ